MYVYIYIYTHKIGTEIYKKYHLYIYICIHTLVCIHFIYHLKWFFWGGFPVLVSHALSTTWGPFLDDGLLGMLGVWVESSAVCDMSWYPLLDVYLVGGWGIPTPLKKIGLCQVGWWESHHKIEKSKSCSNHHHPDVLVPPNHPYLNGIFHDPWFFKANHRHLKCMISPRGFHS